MSGDVTVVVWGLGYCGRNDAALTGVVTDQIDTY